MTIYNKNNPGSRFGYGLGGDIQDASKGAAKGVAAAASVAAAATQAGAVIGTAIPIPFVGSALGAAIGAAIGALIAVAGGVTQDRFFDRYFDIRDAFVKAGYLKLGTSFHENLLDKFKIRKTQVTDKKKKGNYAPEFQRLHNWAITILNASNPGLGTYWGNDFPFIMANLGNIKGEPIKILKELVAKFPPGKYRGEKPFQPGEKVATATEAKGAMIDAQGDVVQVKDSNGNIVVPGTAEYNAALTPSKAGFNFWIGLTLVTIVVGTMIAAGKNEKGKGADVNPLKGTVKLKRKKANK